MIGLISILLVAFGFVVIYYQRKYFRNEKKKSKMEKEDINEMAKKAREYLDSKEGGKKFIENLNAAREFCKNLQEARTVDIKKFFEKITI